MQKVVGSSPIIRSTLEAPLSRFFASLRATRAILPEALVATEWQRS